MNKILNCRRSSLALIGMLLLFIIAIQNKIDVSHSIAAICIGVAAANAHQKKSNAPKN
jgi:hypothetical protein